MSRRRRSTPRLAALWFALALAGAAEAADAAPTPATAAPAPEPTAPVAEPAIAPTIAPAAAGGVYDPFEPYNRVMFRFNLAVDRAVLRPVARGYRDGVPQQVRTGVANFLDNLENPLSMVNNLLQAKPRRALSDLGRFVINLTMGVGGVLDPADGFDLPQGQEDFGQTLGHWGWGQGPYLVLPFLPPGGLRDQLGKVPEQRLDPFTYAETEYVEYAGKALDIVEGRSRVLDLDETLDSAYDPYGFVRDAVTQRRAYLVRDGAAEPLDYDDLYEDPLEDEALEPPPESAAEAPPSEPPPR